MHLFDRFLGIIYTEILEIFSLSKTKILSRGFCYFLSFDKSSLRLRRADLHMIYSNTMETTLSL